VAKKETGQFSPASGASVEMRLHRTGALARRFLRTLFAPTCASRASKVLKRSEDTTERKEQLWGQCHGFSDG
jgi:hypothetical protein